MRFVIKVGTSLVTNEDYTLNAGFLRTMASQIARMQGMGHEVVIVSSGAVAAGRSCIKIEHEKKSIPFRQALAAIGQGILMKTYDRFFHKYGINVAQGLLTNYDFANRANFFNTKNVFELLLKKKVIPIVNENDVTTIAEIKFGDNDILSAKTASMISADFLVLLTDVDGLFSADPKENPDAVLLNFVDKIDEKITSVAGGARSGNSRGGMITKVRAAQYSTEEGTHMFIVNGHAKKIIAKVAEFCEKFAAYNEEVLVAKNAGSTKKIALPKFKYGTFFISNANLVPSHKKWLRPKVMSDAWIEIDCGALKALANSGKSLLPSGITAVHGEFERGDVVFIKCGQESVGYGQVNYGAEEIDKIKKQGTDKIEDILGFCFEEEAIHRDRMVVCIE